jgi:hypothetical protein
MRHAIPHLSGIPSAIPEFFHPVAGGLYSNPVIAEMKVAKSSPLALERRPGTFSNASKGEVAARIIQSEPLSGDGEGLTGGAADKKVNCSISVFLNGGEIAMARHRGVMVREDGAGELIYF